MKKSPFAKAKVESKKPTTKRKAMEMMENDQQRGAGDLNYREATKRLLLFAQQQQELILKQGADIVQLKHRVATLQSTRPIAMVTFQRFMAMIQDRFIKLNQRVEAVELQDTLVFEQQTVLPDKFDFDLHDWGLQGDSPLLAAKPIDERAEGNSLSSPPVSVNGQKIEFKFSATNTR